MAENWLTLVQYLLLLLLLLLLTGATVYLRDCLSDEFHLPLRRQRGRLSFSSARHLLLHTSAETD